MIIARISALTLSSLLGMLLILTLTNCQKKKSRGNDGATFEVEKERIIGEETDPITPEKVVVIETTDSGATRLLRVEATDAMEEGRYMSEYLMIVRAQAKSCIRLKVRPTRGGVNDSIDQSNLEDEGGTEACSAKTEEKASTKLVGSDTLSHRAKEKVSHLNFNGPTGRALTNRAFGLVENTLCSSRLFRMPTTLEEGVENVRNKTGRLAYRRSITVNNQERWVNVWVDEEIVRIACGPNGMLDNDRVAFSPLWKYGHTDTFDALTFDHVKAVADNAAESYKTLAETYGDISDVDENTSMDIFISSEINRLRFEKIATSSINSFRALLSLRSNDLANYDALTNPAGNEGEIIYLWAPDPFSRFSDRIFPSSGSLSTNYARGYIGSQIMNLIATKKKLLDRKKPQEENWLRESLAYLASAYVGGNDYSFFYLANYLSSRPQHISLTDDINKKLFNKHSISFADDEQAGMRAMFGWYLHSQLCGANLQPCARIVELMDSDEVGIANLEKVLGKKFSKILEHFGLSVGVQLVDRPVLTKSFWENSNLLESLPEKYVDFPQLRQLSNGGETRFVNVENDARNQRVQTMRRYAGPFVSFDMEIFQPILPDNDIDITLENNSVAYIHLMGLINKTTDITATLGRHLNVVIVPIGERTSDAVRPKNTKRSRFVHLEKVSENAHIDVAPANLTTKVADRIPIPGMNPTYTDEFAYPEHTYYMPLEYPNLADEGRTVLTKDRELWIIGNIENEKISIEGTPTSVGDTDTFNIEVQPCKDSTDNNCASKNHQVIVQMYSRDHHTEAYPMFLVTSTDPSLFRGAEILSTVADWDPSADEAIQKNYDHLDKVTPIFCDSSSNYPGLGVNNLCANNGQLENGGSKPFFKHQDYLSDSVFAQTIDNFLFMGPLTFPFYNNGNAITSTDFVRDGIFDFSREEAARMFYDFNFIKGNKPYNYILARARYDASLPDHTYVPGQTARIPLGSPKFHTLMSEDERLNYINIKSFMDNCCTTLNDDSLEVFISYCTTAGVNDSQCRSINNAKGDDLADVTHNTLRTNLENAIKSTLYDPNDRSLRKFVTCFGSDCNALVQDLNTPGNSTTSWDVPSIAMQTGGTSGIYQSWYHAFIVNEDPTDDRPCSAQVEGDPTFMINNTSDCLLKDAEPFSMKNGDIRHQFNVASDEFRLNCSIASRVEDNNCSLAQLKVSSEPISYLRVENPDNQAYFMAAKQLIDGELSIGINEHPIAPIATSAGELVAKETRYHAQAISVPGSTSSVFQIIAGGREKSQGKYMIRVRLKEYNRKSASQLNHGNY